MPDQALKFLFVSIDALISDIAWQVSKEGHEVRYYIENEGERSIGDGFVPKIDKWKPHVDWADVMNSGQRPTFAGCTFATRSGSCAALPGDRDVVRGWQM